MRTKLEQSAAEPAHANASPARVVRRPRPPPPRPPPPRISSIFESDELMLRIATEVAADKGSVGTGSCTVKEIRHSIHLYGTRVTRLSVVNQRWYKVCMPLLWKSIALSPWHDADRAGTRKMLAKFRTSIKTISVKFDNPTRDEAEWTRDTLSSQAVKLVHNVEFSIAVQRYGSGVFETAAVIVRTVGQRLKSLAFKLDCDSDPAEGYPVIAEMLDYTPQLEQLTVRVRFHPGRDDAFLRRDYHGYHHERLVRRARACKIKRVAIGGLGAWMEPEYDSDGSV